MSMNEQELREKIIETLEKGGRNFLKSKETKVSIYEYYADALIAAGMGDVKEVEHRARVAEDELARHKRALRIAGDKFINEVCNMRGEDISDKCDYKCDTCFYDYYLQQAEKELEEERKDDSSGD